MASEESEHGAGEDRADSHERVDRVAVDALEDAGVALGAVRERRTSYRDLVDAGVDQDVATALRREFSLPYSTRFGEGVAARSDEVSGLQAGEREWVAASGSDWEAMGVPEYEPIERERGDVWVGRDRPTPVTAVPGVGPADADRLAEVGVTSVRQLSVVDAAAVAALLDVDVMAVRTWRFAARDGP